MKSNQQRRGLKPRDQRKNKKTPRSGPLAISRPVSRVSYCDSAVGVTVGTGMFHQNLLDPLLGNTIGLFTVNLQANRIAQQSTAFIYYKNFRITTMSVHLNLVGAQSNTLVAGDLFNRCRLLIWYSEYPYSASSLPGWTIDSMTDFRIVQKMFVDKTFNLPSQAFYTTSGYNVPQCITYDRSLPIGRLFESYSVNPLADQWDTRKGNVYISLVSDSAISPGPFVSGSVRLYYEETDQ